MSFDLFDALAKISSRDQRWYDKLTDEDQRAASVLVLARWLTGTSDQAQLIRLNIAVNPYGFVLGQEKALLFKLMAAACTGRGARYHWLKAPGPRTTTRLRLQAISAYYDVSTREAALVAAGVPSADILEMAELLGWSTEELKRLQKEVQDGSGGTKSPSSRKANRG